jgi:hypothetical protein
MAGMAVWCVAVMLLLSFTPSALSMSCVRLGDISKYYLLLYLSLKSHSYFSLSLSLYLSLSLSDPLSLTKYKDSAPQPGLSLHFWGKIVSICLIFSQSETERVATKK